uniref:Serpin domain-containing protein n=1 Tax=Ciona savignyi TaxID=51511 RepID=H2YNS4_CIOSA
MNTIPDERLPNLMKKSFTNVALRHTGQTIRLANAIFVRDEYPVKQPYIDTLRTYYKSAVKTFDVRNSTAASNLVNRWVASNTENRITDLVDPSAFTELTRLVLVNAIYFQASWKHKFSAAGEKQFQLANGESVMVPFMHLRKMLY